MSAELTARFTAGPELGNAGRPEATVDVVVDGAVWTAEVPAVPGAVVDEVGATPSPRAVAGVAVLQAASTTAHASTGADNLVRSRVLRTPTALPA